MADETFTDPLGREIVLHDRTWYGHILKGHRELAGEREYAGMAIVEPLEIRHSLSDQDVRLYHGPARRRDVVLRVVVDIELGLVKTAHYVRKPQGGEVEWSS
jgi:hypothetical protein